MSNLNNFHYAMSLCQTLYGIDLKEDEFEEIALIGWNLIGNKRTRIYRYTTSMDSCSDNTIQLPCNCDLLEAVTTGFEDFGNVTNYTSGPDFNSAAIETEIEYLKRFHDPLYQSGKFLKYERVGDVLYFDKHYPKINILYRGIILDDDGLPELTDKEATAIATYCAYITKYREGLMTNNSQIIQLANTLKQQWDIQVNQARVPDYLNQNEMDQVLDAKTSWNRKVHSKSYKYVR